MKNRIMAVTVIVIIAITLVVVFTRNKGESMERLFSEEDITYKNIESVELFEYETNNQMVTDDKDFIKEFSSALENLKSDNITPSIDIGEKPLYVIYISNVGYYPAGGIGIYSHHIEYKGKAQTMTFKESTTLIKLIEDEIQEENH
ncbi:hypothetical protein NCCP2222_35040 [Sporosarcina sp. NCCP-2222]|uniref:hypothetical protein n=1 Tax=Sporosarcina sp. NCCP-2222 TaxID=2935073 RepID=UPI0020866EB4|nr:hypothetical protein [Sporosarcina sp. NCCP-2222]GKV57557.1 hypothetical protein NCCP2222_35040 [Sporosarcina sp. NCCP-2222]